MEPEQTSSLKTSQLLWAKALKPIDPKGYYDMIKSRKNIDAYVLLLPDAKEAIDILLETRKAVGVLITNPYILFQKHLLIGINSKTHASVIFTNIPGFMVISDIFPRCTHCALLKGKYRL